MSRPRRIATMYLGRAALNLGGHFVETGESTHNYENSLLLLN